MDKQDGEKDTEMASTARRSASDSKLLRSSSSSRKTERTASDAKPFRLDRRNVHLLNQELDEQHDDMEKKAATGDDKAEDEVAAAQQRLSWRYRVVEFLHSNAVHIPMTALLVLDLILVVVSLELQIQVYRLEGEAKGHCLEAFEAPTAVPEYLESQQDCNPEGLGHCDFHESQAYKTAHLLHEIEIGLAFCSMCILSVFLIENLVMMVVLGGRYFKYFFFMMDLFVVSLSLALEIWAVTSSVEGGVVLGIFVIARMWRFFRVAHGVYFLEHEKEAVGKPLEKQRHRKSESSGSSPSEADDRV